MHKHLGEPIYKLLFYCVRETVRQQPGLTDLETAVQTTSIDRWQFARGASFTSKRRNAIAYLSSYDMSSSRTSGEKVILDLSSGGTRAIANCNCRWFFDRTSTNRRLSRQTGLTISPLAVSLRLRSPAFTVGGALSGRGLSP